MDSEPTDANSGENIELIACEKNTSFEKALLDDKECSTVKPGSVGNDDDDEEDEADFVGNTYADDLEAYNILYGEKAFSWQQTHDAIDAIDGGSKRKDSSQDSKQDIDSNESRKKTDNKEAAI